MPATDLAATYLGGSTYRLTWGGTADLWQVIASGRLVAETENNAIEIELAPAATVDVIAAGETLPTSWPLGSTLTWFGAADVASYRVERYSGGSWSAVVTLPGTARNYTTPTLDDDTSYQYRLIAIDAVGNESTADEMTFLFIRRPDVPDVSLSFSAGTVTIG